MSTPLFDPEDPFSFEDHFFGMQFLNRYDPGLVGLLKREWAEERRFCREILAPRVLEEDRKHLTDPEYLSWDLVRLAGRHGRISRQIPRMVGGCGEGPLVFFTPLMEETASVDTAFCGMLGGHGLGLVALMLTLNMKVLRRIAAQVVEKEKGERPFLIDCAITEPSAGTDVEEADLYPRARLMCQARRVPGGAVLNGRKVFISTGHLASEHVVLMPFDLSDPLNTFACFLVPGGTPGFSLGRKERKMGQWAAPASELVFEDCFVPEENIVLSAYQLQGEGFAGRTEMLLETVLGISRTMVGAMSTGAARGVFERALRLAKERLYRGRTLVCHQWAQALLTDMFLNVIRARAVYVEATFALMDNLNPLVSGALPRFLNTEAGGRIFRNRWSRGVLESEWLRRNMFRQLLSVAPENNSRIQVMSSAAKVVGSDAAVQNAHLALTLLSEAGLRHDRGVEKFFRDSKLLQIFEGTNQLNRLNIFKHSMAQNLPGVEVY